MSNKQRFAKFYVNTWTDPKVVSLDFFEERFFIHSWSNLWSIRRISGIYEIDRGTLISICGFNDQRFAALKKYELETKDKLISFEVVNKIIDSFNSEHKALLEYHTPEHIMYVKNYFKFQYRTIGNPTVATAMILNDYQESKDKAPQFWAEFGKKNEFDLLSLARKIDNLIESKKSKQPEKEPIKKLDNELKELSHLQARYIDFLQNLSVS